VTYFLSLEAYRLFSCLSVPKFPLGAGGLS
jgi:hypothetical protein